MQNQIIPYNYHPNTLDEICQLHRNKVKSYLYKSQSSKDEVHQQQEQWDWICEECLYTNTQKQEELKYNFQNINQIQYANPQYYANSQKQIPDFYTQGNIQNKKIKQSSEHQHNMISASTIDEEQEITSSSSISSCYSSRRIITNQNLDKSDDFIFNREKEIQSNGISEEFPQNLESYDSKNIYQIIQTEMECIKVTGFKYEIQLPENFYETTPAVFNSLCVLPNQNIVIMGQNFLLACQMNEQYNLLQKPLFTISKMWFSVVEHSSHNFRLVKQEGLQSQNFSIVDWESSSVKTYNFRKKKQVSITKPTQNSCSNWYIAPYGKKLQIYGSMDKSAYIINWKKKKVIKQLQGHTSTILGVGKLNNSQVVTASNDKSLRIWSGITGKMQKLFGKYTMNKSKSLSWQPQYDQNQLNIEIEEQLEQKHDEYSAVDKINDQYLAAATWTNKVFVYDYKNFKEVAVLQHPEMRNNWSVRCIFQKFLLVSGFSDNIFVWNWQTKQLVARFKSQIPCLREIRVAKQTENEAIIVGISQKCQFCVWKFQKQ